MCSEMCIRDRIISIVVVFTIGLPLMPLYVEALSQPIVMPELLVSEYGIAYVEIHVYSHGGYSIPYAVFTAYSSDKVLARYLADKNGVIDATDPDKGLPSLKQYNISIEIAGIIYNTTVNPATDYIRASGGTLLNINIDDIIALGDYRIAFGESIEFREVSKLNDTSFIIKVFAHSGARFIVTTLDYETPYVVVDGVAETPSTTTEYTWYGVKLRAYIYFLVQGGHEILVVVGRGSRAVPSVEEVYYARDVANITFTQPLSFINPVAYIVFNLFIAPLSYIAILISSSYALARVLGGSSPRIIKVMTLAG